MVSKAFDLGDRYRMPAMILSDGLLGQMMEPVVLPTENTVAPVKEWATSGHGNGRKHNVINSLYITPAELERLVKERFAKYEQIKAEHTLAESYLTEDAELVLVAYGASSRICRSAVNTARANGVKVGLIRPITLWPFPERVIGAAAKTAKAFLTVEMSMGQMVDDVRLAVDGEKPVYFFGRTGGIIPTPAEVLRQIELLTGGTK